MLVFSRSLPALRVSLAAACIAGLFLAGTAAMAQAPAPDPVIAKVNGVEIRQSDLAIAEEDIGGSLPPTATPEAKREYLITYLTDMILVAQDAELQGTSSTDEFKRRFQMVRSKVLMELFLRELAKKSVTEEAMHKVYDDAVKQMTPEEEVHARHILVEKEDDAKAIAAQIKGGADFATLAKEKSIEPGAKESGGDLGFFAKEQMVPEFADAAFKLEKGKVSDPVKTQFGWHIIKVEDKRTKPVPSYDQVKDQLQTFVVRKAQSDLVAKLRASAKIERTDPPASATPAPAAPAAPGAATPK
ncbi:MAG: peptidylprolyl isomerase [Xanthobacteraceae bacterium]